MRFSITLALTLLPAIAFAQDDPQPTSKPAAPKSTMLRVEVNALATVDEMPVDPNLMLGFVFTELYKFGIRIDSSQETGNGGLDKWIRGQVKRWEKQEPGAPAASLKIKARQVSTYNGAKFYGETQAHVFKGRTSVAITDAEGKTLAEFSYKFEWGKAIRKMGKDGGVEHRTKPGVMKDYDQFMQKTLVLGLLSQDVIRKGVPKAKKKKLDAYVKKTKDFLLGALEKSTEATREGELARFLRSLPSS